MKFLGIELNDVALTAADGGGVLYREPGFAIANNGELLFGNAAFHMSRLQPRRIHSRYWQAMSEEALTADGAGSRTQADLVHAQLQLLWQSAGSGIDAVVFALPPLWNSEQLGLLLGIADEIGMPVQGLVPSGVAAARQEYTGSELFHLEATLHDFYLQRIVQEDAAFAADHTLCAGTGMSGLQQTCVNYIAKRLLECSRFDALQDAANEQLILDSLPEWLRDLHQSGTVEISLRHGEWNFEATLDAKELQAAMQAYLEPLMQQLRAVLPADRPVVLQIYDELASYPGLVDLLSGQTGAGVFILEPAAAARGAIARAAQFASASGSFSLTNKLTWDKPAITAGPVSGVAAVGEVPTHLVFGSYAYRLCAVPLLAGAALPEGVPGILLEPAAGVSRHHFTVQDTSEGFLLQDHSRYGTWLNGHRIDEGVVLRAGDVITVGPHNLSLIAERSLGALESDGA